MARIICQQCERMRDEDEIRIGTVFCEYHHALYTSDGLVEPFGPPERWCHQCIAEMTKADRHDDQDGRSYVFVDYDGGWVTYIRVVDDPLQKS